MHISLLNKGVRAFIEIWVVLFYGCLTMLPGTSVPKCVLWQVKFWGFKSSSQLKERVVITHSFINHYSINRRNIWFFFASHSNSREVRKYPYLRFMIRQKQENEKIPRKSSMVYWLALIRCVLMQMRGETQYLRPVVGNDILIEINLFTTPPEWLCHTSP